MISRPPPSVLLMLKFKEELLSGSVIMVCAVILFYFIFGLLCSLFSAAYHRDIIPPFYHAQGHKAEMIDMKYQPFFAQTFLLDSYRPILI